MKCDVCGSKKTELLTSWACDTCDFGPAVVFDLALPTTGAGVTVRDGFGQFVNPSTAATGAKEEFSGGPDRSLWDMCKDDALGLGEPAPVRHWDLSKFPRFDQPERFRIMHREYEWDSELENVPANPLSDEVAELVDVASLLWDTAQTACEFVDDLAMKHQLLDDVRALRLALDRIMYKEQTK